MNDALTAIYYVLNKFLDWMFSTYFFTGVSIGMFLIGCFFFTVLLTFVIAIPRISVPNRNRGDRK